MKYIRVQLVRKLANRLNGVDLAPYAVGDVIDLPERSAAILISEGWARAVQAASPLEGARAAPGSPRRQPQR
jgi:hypothetical protein